MTAFLFFLRLPEKMESIVKKHCNSGILMLYYGYNNNCNALHFGLGESSLDHRRREEFPAIFTMVVSFGGVNERT